jgi:tetratricopeptide (TPR) repeat protein
LRIAYIKSNTNPFLNMFKNQSLTLASVLMVVVFAAGCKPKSVASPGNTAGYFQTPFQNESEFIVGAVVSDLAEEMYYEAFHRVPDQKYFLVTAVEKPGSSLDAPTYELQIRLDTKIKEFSLELNAGGPIWSPAVYENVTAQLALAVGARAGGADREADLTLLSKLADGTPETIEKENQDLSAALEKDFGNPELHEEAALLLGAFLLRDHSGNFFEIRSPLTRMTAHLAMARFLRGTGSYGICGKMAQASLLTLVNDEAPALQELDGIGTNDAAVLPMVRALRTRNTGDYRPLADAGDRSRIEDVEWFSAMSDYVATTLAWEKLGDARQRTIDFVRVANQEGYSVEIGHQLLEVSLPLELREIQSVYELSHHDKLLQEDLVNALNEPPERCFSPESDGGVHVRIIGWGQWAAFLQRHLCHAVSQNFRFLNYMWGVPEAAQEFASNCDHELSGLRLYPFVRRFDCTNIEDYHKSVDDGFKVTVASPQLVPAECWNYLCYRVYFAPLYDPNPNPHVNEWHNHNPPPGTVYDLHPRLNHPSLISRAGTLAYFKKLHELAPYDCRIVNFILTRKYTNHPSYDTAMTMFKPILPYSVQALRTVASTVYDQPQQYEKLMLQAAELDPACYYDLGDYEIDQQNEDKAAQYLEKACDADVDAVRVSDHACWRVRYFLSKGQTDKARQIADDAAEVYSSVGLQAKAIFLEATTNYDEAFQWFAKNEERYNDSGPLIDFCLRCKEQRNDQRFDSELQKRTEKLFPQGIEKASLGDFQGPPVDGVLIQQQNDLLLSSGLKAGDVIVALDGTHTHNFVQYRYTRAMQDNPGLDLVVWQGGAYHEVTASPPHHLFGVTFGDYVRP